MLASSGGSTFTTTRRPSAISSATNTRLMPPASSRSNVYAEPRESCRRSRRSRFTASLLVQAFEDAACVRSALQGNPSHVKSEVARHGMGRAMVGFPRLRVIPIESARVLPIFGEPPTDAAGEHGHDGLLPSTAAV